MPPAPLPPNETQRLAALHSYEVLDSACEDSFDTIVRLAGRLTESPMALVSLADADRQWFKARFGLDVVEVPRDHAFCGYALLDPSQPLVVADMTQDARFADNPLVTGAPDVRFYAGAPLVNQDGFALGTLCVMDTKSRQLSPDSVETLVGLAQAVTTTLELRRAMRRAQLMALTDGLTNLPNRSAFLGALDVALARQNRAGEPFALVLIDLDGFKQINDVLGHAAGDRVLTKAAEVLQACVRREDTAARLGGDEFALILAAASASEAALAAERVRTQIETSMLSRGWAVTASVGVVAFTAAPASDTEALAMTDKLLYAAKEAGKNCVVWQEFSGSAMAEPVV